MKLTNHSNQSMDRVNDRIRFLHTYQIKDQETLRLILEGDPVSFVNVRHPFERLVSGYLMAKKHQDYIEKTFEQFVLQDVLEKVKTTKDRLSFREMNSHFRPSNTYCAFCNIKYGVVSKMENFNEDKERVMEILGVEDKQAGQRLNINGGQTIKNLTRELFKNISENYKAALFNIYKYDFLMFNYDAELK